MLKQDTIKEDMNNNDKWSKKGLWIEKDWLNEDYYYISIRLLKYVRFIYILI